MIILEVTSGVSVVSLEFGSHMFGVCMLREECELDFTGRRLQDMFPRQWIHVRLPVYGGLENVHSFST